MITYLGKTCTLRNKGQTSWWYKLLFRKAIHPRISIWGWRLCHGRLPSDDNLQKKGIVLVSRCCLCSQSVETIKHLFWDCSFSSSLWIWLEDLFKVRILERNLKSLVLEGDKMTPYVHDLWIGAIWGGSNLIWQARNNRIFENQLTTLAKEQRKWSKLIQDTTLLSSRIMFSCQTDLSILHSLRVLLHHGRSTAVKSRFWELPEKDEVKINTDRTARGNPGKGGIGCIYRDCNGKVLGTLAKGLGLVTNFTAECKAIIQGIEFASSNGWLIAWVESDSKAAVEAFNSDKIPWILEVD
ncbi:hypothetical protein GIB67_016506 [Kingdonia uniflora]|uniref:RNase H type-1 domain-containing protein n=1 Tax=Kingdonia uniflora TaxID=39325 RepID=A0A7J7M8E8_9MAGN|nr:hypothetical protein GIB67_016506 [Kingdonia uniflora]